MSELGMQMEFRDGPLEGTCRHSIVAPERMWFASTTGPQGFVRVDHGDEVAPDPAWEGQVEYRRTAGPIGGVVIYRVVES